MSPPICFIERSAQGDLIHRVRLVAERLDETYEASPAMAALDRAVSAAHWVCEVIADYAERSLACVCLDASGAVAGWIRPTTRDARVIETMIRHSDGEMLVGVQHAQGATLEENAGETLLGPDYTMPGGASFQVALPGIESEDARAIVLAVRDACVRVFLDELDAKGVHVQGVATIWHLIASAWDPGGVLARRSPSSDEVEGEAQTSAICLLEPRGVLDWCWSRAGHVIAGGTMRVPLASDARPVLRASALARLRSDWLAWSAQLATVPTRAVLITPELASDDDGALSRAELSEHLARALPSAAVDVAVVEDPVGETCARVVGLRGEAVCPPDDPTRSLPALIHRPGRTHRAMYRWASLAMLVIAIGAGLATMTLFDHAHRAREAATRFRNEQIRLYTQIPDTEPASGMRAVLALQDMIDTRRRELDEGAGLSPPRPIMRELDTILFTLGLYPDVELKKLDLDQGVLSKLVVVVPDTRTYTELKQSLTSMDTSLVLASDNPVSRAGKVEVTLNFAWGEP